MLVTKGGMMKVFEDYTYKWWEAGVFKVGMLTAGAIVGAFFADFVLDYLAPLVVLAVICIGYTLYASFRQK